MTLVAELRDWLAGTAKTSEGVDSSIAPAPSPDLKSIMTSETSAVAARTDLDLSTIPTFRLLPSHKLPHKLTRILSALYPVESSASTADPPPQSCVIGASAPATHAARLITLVEQAKRKVEEKGDVWYQYNVMSASAAKPKKPATAPAVVEPEEPKHSEEEEEEDLFAAYQEEKKREKVENREVVVLTVYLSTKRIEKLAREWGEQTNATS